MTLSSLDDLFRFLDQTWQGLLQKQRQDQRQTCEYPAVKDSQGYHVTKNIQGHVYSVQFKTGDRVFGFLDTGFPWLTRGTHAEYIAASEKHLAIIPQGVSFEAAAAVTCVAATAWQGLNVETLKAGQRILIHAGSGGVGHMAIQLAKLKGLYVITTASTRNHQFLKDLGADECIDYKHADFVQQLRHQPVDLVFESVGGDYTARSLKVLKKSGRHIHIFTGNYSRYGYNPYVALALETRDVFIGVIKGLLGLGPQFQPVGAMQNPQQLAEIGSLMASGNLKVHIDKTFPFAEASIEGPRCLLDEAHWQSHLIYHKGIAFPLIMTGMTLKLKMLRRAAHDYQENGNPRGKVVIKVKE